MGCFDRTCVCEWQPACRRETSQCSGPPRCPGLAGPASSSAGTWTPTRGTKPGEVPEGIFNMIIHYLKKDDKFVFYNLVGDVKILNLSQHMGCLLALQRMLLTNC